MLVIQLIISLIPFGIINLFIKEKINWKKILNLIFYLIIALIILTIYDSFIQQALQKVCNVFPILTSSTILLIFLQRLFYMALPEEIAKYMAIKMSKPKSKLEILNNTMRISTLFIFYENYSYAEQSILIGIWRIILPVHIISQVVMSYYLMKAYDEKDKNIKKYKKYTAFSLIYPIIIHTIYNCYIAISENTIIKTMVILLMGIITYIITAIFIKNMTEKCSGDNEENVIKISKFKIITIILATTFWIYTFMI